MRKFAHAIEQDTAYPLRAYRTFRTAWLLLRFGTLVAKAGICLPKFYSGMIARTYPYPGRVCKKAKTRCDRELCRYREYVPEGYYMQCMVRRYLLCVLAAARHLRYLETGSKWQHNTGRLIDNDGLMTFWTAHCSCRSRTM